MLDGLDAHTMTLLRILKLFAKTPDLDVDLKPTVVRIPSSKKPLPKLDMFYGSKIPTWDEDKPEGGGLASKLVFDYLRSGKLNPLTDLATEWESLKQARSIISVGFKEDLSPLQLVEWKEMTSDHAISRWAFAGLAAHVTTRTVKGTGDVVDVCQHERPEGPLRSPSVLAGDLIGPLSSQVHS